MTEPQSASAVMMIRPLRFTANPLTASTNAFQSSASVAVDDVLEAARSEFDRLAAKLAAAGVQVCVFEDTPEPDTPDAVFPNNWITTHADGTVALYPMMAANRRVERRPELIDRLVSEHGFSVKTIVDLSPHEKHDRILEGTGSMILDRVNRIAYACTSARTDPGVLAEFCERFDYRPFVFESVDSRGLAIYHTNVMMTLGTEFAVVCSASIPDPARRAELIRSLTDTGHEIVDISFEQVESFAGNMLELSAGNRRIVAMSQRARDSLSPAQVATLERHVEIVSSPIDTLENCGGGSVRCMLAEIFLPRKGID